MRLIKPSYEIWQQPSGLEGIYKQIEHVGRVCYKSEDKITEDSAKPFVDRMIKSGHGAMLEHGTVYLKMPVIWQDDMVRIPTNSVRKYQENPYSRVEIAELDDTDEYFAYVTTNLRVIVENKYEKDLQYLCEPTEYHEKRITVHFVCDRGVSHEFVRHRVFSFAQESTRYCNYSKDKFGNELTFIIPCWFEDNIDYVADYMSGKGDIDKLAFIDTLHCAEHNYLGLLMEGWKPQEARAVLPNALKTELVMTGFISDWKHFFDLRAIGTTGQPHPQAKELALPLLNEFTTNKYF